MLPVSVHGNWGEWAIWGACSEGCGDGQKTRTRACDTPRKEHGGNDCSTDEYSETMTETCNDGPCKG